MGRSQLFTDYYSLGALRLDLPSLLDLTRIPRVLCLGVCGSQGPGKAMCYDFCPGNQHGLRHLAFRSSGCCYDITTLLGTVVLGRSFIPILVGVILGLIFTYARYSKGLLASTVQYLPTL